MKSLMDGINSGSSAKPAKGKASGNTLKVTVASVLFVVAAVLIAWNFEIISFGGKEEPPPPPTPQEQAAVQKHNTETQQAIQKGTVTEGSN
jgi:hypothetical protein